MAMFHISVSRDILILFGDHQDTRTESCEMELSINQPIFTRKNIKGSTGKLYPYSTGWEKNIVVIIHVYGDRAI